MAPIKAFPKFRYHPDPVATGMVVSSKVECICCGRSRGYVYVGSVYSVRRDLRDRICPWCIADGTAAAKLKASFASGDVPFYAEVSSDVCAEVTQRTPGYISWQETSWLSHCNDACEYHGDASVKDVANVGADSKRDFLATYHLDEQTWQSLTDGYQPGGDLAIYKFVCRHCGLVRFAYDCS